MKKLSISPKILDYLIAHDKFRTNNARNIDSCITAVARNPRGQFSTRIFESTVTQHARSLTIHATRTGSRVFSPCEFLLNNVHYSGIYSWAHNRAPTLRRDRQASSSMFPREGTYLVPARIFSTNPQRGYIYTDKNIRKLPYS